MAEQGSVSEFHAEQLASYLRFATLKRSEALREVEVAFTEALDAKLTDDDKLYTSEEVSELVKGVSRAVKGDVQNELLHTSHVTALVLRQLFTQAEEIFLDLHVDTTQLENQYLLQEMAAFDESREAGSSKLKPLSKVTSSAAVQHALGAKGKAEDKMKALQQQCVTLMKENERLRAAAAAAPAAAASHPASPRSTSPSAAKKATLSEEPATAAKHAAAQAAPAKHQAAAAAVPHAAGHQATVSAAAPAAAAGAAPDAAGKEALAAVEQMRKEIDQLKKDLAAEHATAQAEHEKAARATADLTKKLQATAPFMNLRKMLKAKNDSVRVLRDLLKKYAPNAPMPEGTEDDAKVAADD